jgi:hypothetical protein
MRGFCNYVKDESVVKWLVLMYAPRTELERYFGTAANVDFLKRLLTSFVTKADFGRLEALVQATPEECRTRFFNTAVVLLLNHRLKLDVPDSIMFSPLLAVDFVLHECVSYEAVSGPSAGLTGAISLHRPLAKLLRTGRLTTTDVINESRHSSAHLLPFVLQWLRFDSDSMIVMMKNVAARTELKGLRWLLHYASDDVQAQLKQDARHWSSWTLGLLSDSRMTAATKADVSAVLEALDVPAWHPEVMTGTAVRAKALHGRGHVNTGVLACILARAFHVEDHVFLANFFGPCIENLAKGTYCLVETCPLVACTWQPDAMADMARCPSKYRPVFVNCLHWLPQSVVSAEEFAWWYRKLMQARFRLRPQHQCVPSYNRPLGFPRRWSPSDSVRVVNMHLRWSIVRALWVSCVAL